MSLEEKSLMAIEWIGITKKCLKQSVGEEEQARETHDWCVAYVEKEHQHKLDETDSTQQQRETIGVHKNVALIQC